MLNLTRNIGQSINIGDDVELIVLDVKANAVKIGVIAPNEISVHRKEVYDRIQLDKDVAK
jgi:carbon storage regulator